MSPTSEAQPAPAAERASTTLVVDPTTRQPSHAAAAAAAPASLPVQSYPNAHHTALLPCCSKRSSRQSVEATNTTTATVSALALLPLELWGDALVLAADGSLAWLFRASLASRALHDRCWRLSPLPPARVLRDRMLRVAAKCAKEDAAAAAAAAAGATVAAATDPFLFPAIPPPPVQELRISPRAASHQVDVLFCWVGVLPRFNAVLMALLSGSVPALSPDVHTHALEALVACSFLADSAVLVDAARILVHAGFNVSLDAARYAIAAYTPPPFLDFLLDQCYRTLPAPAVPELLQLTMEAAKDGNISALRWCAPRVAAAVLPLVAGDPKIANFLAIVSSQAMLAGGLDAMHVLSKHGLLWPPTGSKSSSLSPVYDTPQDFTLLADAARAGYPDVVKYLIIRSQGGLEQRNVDGATAFITAAQNAPGFIVRDDPDWSAAAQRFTHRHYPPMALDANERRIRELATTRRLCDQLQRLSNLVALSKPDAVAARSAAGDPVRWLERIAAELVSMNDGCDSVEAAAHLLAQPTTEALNLVRRASERVSRADRIATVRLLIDAGADLDALSDHGWTALHFVCSTRRHPSSVDRELLALILGLDVDQFLLNASVQGSPDEEDDNNEQTGGVGESGGLDTDAGPTLATPSRPAWRRANPDLPTRTAADAPLYIALDDAGDPAAAKMLLLARVYKTRMRLSAGDYHPERPGFTPLHQAERRGHLAAVGLALGDTPLRVASCAGDGGGGGGGGSGSGEEHTSDSNSEGTASRAADVDSNTPLHVTARDTGLANGPGRLRALFTALAQAEPAMLHARNVDEQMPLDVAATPVAEALLAALDAVRATSQDFVLETLDGVGSLEALFA
ncbi:hypothetical protein HK405_007165 [Cladochytrium tenue]|nr:hypothetical protein HK405_007165 [Cladochytrium tenue]